MPSSGPSGTFEGRAHFTDARRPRLLHARRGPRSLFRTRGRYATEGGRARGWVGQEVQVEGAFGGPCRAAPPRPRLRPPGAPGPWRETRDMLWSAYLHLLNLRCDHRRGAPPWEAAGHGGG